MLSQDILSDDGSLLIKSDIPLTQQVISILAHLKNAGAVKLVAADGGEAASDDTEGDGVFANFQPGPENDGRKMAFDSESPPTERLTRAMKGDTTWEKCLPAIEIPEGSTLARDIYTTDGRLYMYAGSRLTGKIISMLRDLQKLENLETGIWIAT